MREEIGGDKRRGEEMREAERAFSSGFLVAFLGF